MKPRLTLLICCNLALIFAQLGWATPVALQIGEAETAYAKGEFAMAKRHYQQALTEMAKQGSSNGHLLYNLGNCHFRLGEYGMAMLQYRRAELFIPNDQDLKANIETLADKLKLTTEESRPWFENIFFWIHHTSLRTLLFVTLLVHLAFFLIIALRPWIGRRAWLNIFATGLAVYLPLCISLLIASWRLKQPEGIVVAPTVELRSGRGVDFIPILKLGQGASFTILEKKPAWWKIATGPRQEHKGWAKQQHLREVGAWSLLQGQNITPLYAKENQPSAIDSNQAQK